MLATHMPAHAEKISADQAFVQNFARMPYGIDLKNPFTMSNIQTSLPAGTLSLQPET